MQAELSGGSALAALGGDPLPDTPIGLGGVLVLLPALPFTLPFTLFRDNIIHRKDLLGGRGGVRSRRTQERRQRKGYEKTMNYVRTNEMILPQLSILQAPCP